MIVFVTSAMYNQALPAIGPMANPTIASSDERDAAQVVDYTDFDATNVHVLDFAITYPFRVICEAWTQDPHRFTN